MTSCGAGPATLPSPSHELAILTRAQGPNPKIPIESITTDSLRVLDTRTGSIQQPIVLDQVSSSSLGVDAVLLSPDGIHAFAEIEPSDGFASLVPVDLRDRSIRPAIRIGYNVSLQSAVFVHGGRDLLVPTFEPTYVRSNAPRGIPIYPDAYSRGHVVLDISVATGNVVRRMQTCTGPDDVTAQPRSSVAWILCEGDAINPAAVQPLDTVNMTVGRAVDLPVDFAPGTMAFLANRTDAVVDALGCRTASCIASRYCLGSLCTPGTAELIDFSLRTRNFTGSPAQIGNAHLFDADPASPPDALHCVLLTVNNPPVQVTTSAPEASTNVPLPSQSVQLATVNLQAGTVIQQGPVVSLPLHGAFIDTASSSHPLLVYMAAGTSSAGRSMAIATSVDLSTGIASGHATLDGVNFNRPIVVWGPSSGLWFRTGNRAVEVDLSGLRVVRTISIPSGTNSMTFPEIVR